MLLVVSPGSGVGGADAHALSHWLSPFWSASQRLRQLWLIWRHGWPTSRLHGLLFEHSCLVDFLP
jgi:hypothetical protein